MQKIEMYLTDLFTRKMYLLKEFFELEWMLL